MVGDSQGFLLGWKVSELGGFFEEAGLFLFCGVFFIRLRQGFGMKQDETLFWKGGWMS